MEIYLISDSEYVKVGISKFPRRRLKQLQTSNARTLRLLKSIPVDNPEDVEKSIHQYLEKLGLRTRGEWFLPTSMDLVVHKFISLVKLAQEDLL